MNIRHNVLEIKRLLQERKEAMHSLSRFLISKGIAPGVTEEIMLELAQEGNELGSVKDVVAARLRVTGELSFERARTLVLVGPTGVGKTTTVLKLADYYLRQKKKVALMSLDEQKKGALQGWAEAKGIPFFETFEESVADLLLIDTEGCNFYQANRVDALGEQIAACPQDAEILLTLSAGAKEVDLYGAVHQFSSLRPTSLLFTKLDETLASGVLVNVCVKTDLPLRYVAYGFPLPGEVQLADAKIITHKILTDFNQEEFQLLRQLTLPVI